MSTIYEKVKIGFGSDDGLNQKRFDIIDKYTNGRCSYIFQLIWDYREHYKEYLKIFGDTAPKHFLLEYDIQNVAYYDEKLGIEFTFLSNHHSCCPNSMYDYVLNRMAEELQECFLKAYNELIVLDEDSPAVKTFKKEYGDILYFPYIGGNYEIWGNHKIKKGL